MSALQMRPRHTQLLSYGDSARSFLSIEASLVLFFMLALFYTLVPIPVVYHTITGRRGNRKNSLIKD